MKRGDVYWVNLDPTRGSEIRKTRPCILVGATPINKARRTVVVVPISSSGVPRPPLAVPVNCFGKQALAVCDQIRAIDKTRLVRRAESLGKADLAELDKNLRQVLSL
ncbi:MAG: PemK family transcriptional regulator [Deltaproteobacteria bacterium]|nr:MAG: PemK family transcriptional regulator [Deltaproteobacteria bacterium]